ncbi:MAG: ribosome silencing factor [Lachnospiraceae bacterium]|jgi:ribosome-associated protein|nr:ribosome silencing factor [Lachnospiraceae bacterium]MCI1329082.1 ribosome silencing factor [Lachnospiraceae bacterium]
MTETRKMADLVIRALEDKKASDIRLLDISGISTLADYFIIASGSNRSQLQAMCDNVDESMGRAGYEARQIEGFRTANWILLDYGDVVVHLFDRENREFYGLDRIWGDAVSLPLHGDVQE